MRKKTCADILFPVSVALLLTVLLQAGFFDKPVLAATASTDSEAWMSRALKAEEELARLRAMVEKSKPQLPQPVTVTLDPKTTALLILDLSNRCNDPAQPCRELAPRVKDFLPKARAAKVFTVYTVSAGAKDTPQGKVWDNFGVLPDELVIAPDSIDKFFGSELGALLQKRGIKTVIITGASTNNAVLYTATSAARMYKFNVVIPLDGVIARNSYESEYPLYQFTVLASGANERFTFTTLGGISFK